MPRNYELTRTIASVHRHLTARDESPPEVKEILVEANGLHSEKILPNAGKLLCRFISGGPLGGWIGSVLGDHGVFVPAVHSLFYRYY